MLKYYSLIFCLLSLNVALGQVTASNKLQAKNYLDYYTTIATIEEAVVNGNYETAVKQYHTIFEAYAYNNPIDCYIAAQVAAYIKDTASAMSFLYKGLTFGLPVETILSNPHLKACFQNANRSIVDSCWSTYKKNIDTTARSAMIALIQYDQSIVRALPLGELYEHDVKGRKLKSKYAPIWDSLLNQLIAITSAHGFPAQKIIGTQNGEDSLFRIGPNAIFASFIFIHHGNAWNQVADILWAELLSGNITPQMYGVIYEASNGKYYYDNPIRYFASRPCQYKDCKKLVKDNISAINNARKKAGMCSYEVMEKKFASRHRYLQWSKKAIKKSEPFFDFQCELGFQGI